MPLPHGMHGMTVQRFFQGELARVQVTRHLRDLHRASVFAAQVARKAVGEFTMRLQPQGGGLRCLSCGGGPFGVPQAVELPGCHVGGGHAGG